MCLRQKNRPSGGLTGRSARIIVVLMENTGKQPKNDVLRGTVFILIAAFFFSLLSIFVRLSGDLPVMQKAFFRNFMALLVTGCALLRSKEKVRIQPGCLPYHLLRSLFGTVGMIANFWAIDRIGIADANMLNKLSPFFVVLLSAPILKEKPGRVDILCVLAAFAGAVLVVRPSAGVASLPALVGVLGGLCAGIAYTFLRKMGLKGERGAVIVVFFSAFSCLACLPALLFDYHPMTGRQLLFLLLAGSSAAAAQLSITAAYRCAPARDISIFDYSQVLHAALLGFLLLGEVPQRLSILGYAVIISAAVFRFVYNKRRYAA